VAEAAKQSHQELALVFDVLSDRLSTI